uniref:DUF38 domain-containing protein n=1 Tax=Panagrolaimus sp. ES5 TaxID=591445 RepID=A0AC34GNC9_9BILA
MDSIDSTMIPSDEEINVPCTLGLPESILFYIKHNAHPRFQLKLMQTSKYFRFKEFPYSVVRDIEYDDDDGCIAWFDEIIKLLPKLKEFDCCFNEKMASTFTPDMTKNMIDYLNPEILEFAMYGIPEAFDFKLFANFMKANPSIKFRLEWYDSVSDEYTQMLKDYVDELIETSSYKNRKIFICFDGQTDESYNLLYNHYY